MHKILTLLTGCTLFALFSYAQPGDNDVFVGLKVGLNASSFQLSDNVATGLAADPRFQPAGGVFFNLPISKKFSVQPELLYSVMGARLKNAGNDINVGLGYASVPVQLKYKVTDNFNFLLGPQLDVLVNARRKSNISNTTSRRDLGKDDLSATGGVEFWPTERLMLGARYIHGFQDVSTFEPGNWNNRGVQFSLGFRLTKKPTPPPPPPPPPPPSDRDKDGIIDDEDKCPDEPGVAKYQGCPVPDTDKDGINDEEDKCPTVPGIAKYQGCPIPDSDNDGVNDEDDKCPDIAGLARYDGCPIPDRDNDGVNDEEDRCPDIAGPADNGGCPMLEASKFNASAVQFVSGSAVLTALAKRELDKAARILNEQYPTLQLEINGHTDNTGNASSNQVLSEKRANAVKAYLVKKGVSEARIQAVGFGQDQPVADNQTAGGRKTNRRVEFKVRQ